MLSFSSSIFSCFFLCPLSPPDEPRQRVLQKISARCLCSGDSGAAIGLSPAFYRRLVRHWSATTGPKEGGIGHRSPVRRGSGSFHVTIVGIDVIVVGCDVTAVCSDVTLHDVYRNLGVDGDPTPIFALVSL
jgi:hypothetical protein